MIGVTIGEKYGEGDSSSSSSHSSTILWDPNLSFLQTSSKLRKREKISG